MQTHKGEAGARSPPQGPQQSGNPLVLERNHKGAIVKHKQVLAKVYEPERLQKAWQQVKRNALVVE